MGQIKTLTHHALAQGENSMKRWLMVLAVLGGIALASSTASAGPFCRRSYGHRAYYGYGYGYRYTYPSYGYGVSGGFYRGPSYGYSGYYSPGYSLGFRYPVSGFSIGGYGYPGYTGYGYSSYGLNSMGYGSSFGYGW